MYNLAFLYLFKARQTKSEALYKEAASMLMTIMVKDSTKVEPYYYLG